jgi:hypothetical protein
LPTQTQTTAGLRAYRVDPARESTGNRRATPVGGGNPAAQTPGLPDRRSFRGRMAKHPICRVCPHRQRRQSASRANPARSGAGDLEAGNGVGSPPVGSHREGLVQTRVPRHSTPNRTERSQGAVAIGTSAPDGERRGRDRSDGASTSASVGRNGGPLGGRSEDSSIANAQADRPHHSLPPARAGHAPRQALDDRGEPGPGLV